MPIIKKPIIILLSALLLSQCGTTLIADQERADLSVATMYLDFVPGFVKDAFFINRETGKEYANSRYGWGKEFFPREHRFSFFALGNLPAGTYELTRLQVYHISSTKMLAIPKDALVFTVAANEIKFLGQVTITLTDSPASPTVSTGRRKTTALSNSAGQNFQISHEDAPDGNDRFRDGEEFFLEFFISKKNALPRWTELAKKRLAEIEILKSKL